MIRKQFFMVNKIIIKPRKTVHNKHINIAILPVRVYKFLTSKEMIQYEVIINAILNNEYYGTYTMQTRKTYHWFWIINAIINARSNTFLSVLMAYCFFHLGLSKIINQIEKKGGEDQQQSRDTPYTFGINTIGNT